MAFTQLRSIWQGFTGAPGYSHHDFMGQLTPTQAAARAADLRIFWAALSTLIPTGTSITVQSTAQIFDDNHVLTGEIPVNPQPAAVNCSGSGSYQGGGGAVIFLRTGAISLGRKVTGRLYIVPMTGNSYSTDGSLAAGTVTTLQTAMTTLIAGSPGLAVNSRKTKGGVVANQTNIVTASSVPDRPAVLRTRRS